MKKVMIGVGLALGLLLLCAAVYVAYVFFSYDRIEDGQALPVAIPEEVRDRELAPGEEYRILTYNVGFGAYRPDFSFFMDGGESSWAKSKESVEEAIRGAGELISSRKPDFVLIQELDIDATRSYHVDELEMMSEILSESASVMAVNYDSAFLMYPLTQPHGKSKSGIATFSGYPILSSVRRSLPVATSFSKLFDLDRCYSVSRIPVSNERELILINLHMSAYTKDEAVRTGQIAMLAEEMEKECRAGNYVICGGDFNHDLKALGAPEREALSWSQPFPRESLPEQVSFALDGLTQRERDGLWDSARNADMEYVPGVTYTVTLDGFIISDNVECVRYETIPTGYEYSDHEPVEMTFRLR